MLIDGKLIQDLLARHSVSVRGVLHIGAHDCEEMPFYEQLGVSPNKVVWIDAIQSKVDAATARGIPNVHFAVVSDADGDTVTFHRTNNDQSSSILELGTHLTVHPNVYVVETTVMKTTTIDRFMDNKHLDARNYNFWNLDVQGAEYKALLGSQLSLQYVDALYLEVNDSELYKGCTLFPEMDRFLKDKGFTRIIKSMTNCGWGDALYIRVK